MIEKKNFVKNFLKLEVPLKIKKKKEKKICNFLSSLNFEKKTILSGYYPVRNEVNILPFLKHFTKKRVHYMSSMYCKD